VRKVPQVLGCSATRWAQANIGARQAQREVDPARLVFAERTEPGGDLARHRLADRFWTRSRTMAHTTARRRVMGGLPVLTCRGRACAGVWRECAADVDCPSSSPTISRPMRGVALVLHTRPGSDWGLSGPTLAATGSMATLRYRTAFEELEDGLRENVDSRQSGAPAQASRSTNQTQ